MLPVIALVGRPNVGKSTLFNRLTRTRDALVASQPGLTRDRQYGIGKLGDRPYIVVDTGGLSGAGDGLDGLMARQSLLAVQEADRILFLVDGREGLTAADQAVAEQLRRFGKPVILTVNKTDGLDDAVVTAEFHSLGLGDPQPIAAVHGRGVSRLMEQVFAQFPDQGQSEAANEAFSDIRVAIVGRPNVGKSTLINRFLGEERVLVFDRPGTTRDSVFIPFKRDGQAFTLIDTAGVRRRARVHEVIEKFSVIKTLDAIERAHVVVLLIDAQREVSDQDASLLGHVLEAGRAIVIAVNKWDGLDQDQRSQRRRELDIKFPFLDFARIHFISALHGSGVGNLFDSIREAYTSATRKLATPQLTRILEDAVQAHAVPMVRGRRIKLRYAHQGGQNPPLIVIHGNQTEALPEAYRRYLTNAFRKVLGLMGTPVRLVFKTGANPYQGRKNKLTPRQLKHRKRLMTFAKRRKR